jgi:hypothetical protein
MSERAIRVTWSFLGVLLMAFSAAALLRTTASQAPEKLLPLNSFGAYGVTLLAIPIGSAMLLAVLWLTRRYPSGRSATQTWASRLPVFYFERSDIDCRSRDGKTYQLAFLLGFILGPALTQVLLYIKFLSGTVCFGKDKAATDIVWLKHFWPTGVMWPSVAGSGYSLDGLTYYPLFQPWAYLALECVVIAATIRTVLWLVRGTLGR